MPNTSATGGYLVPATSPNPLEDEAFEDFLHDVFAGLTGLANGAVLPRWQPEPPNQKDFPDNWLAFGIMVLDADSYASIVHDSETNVVPPGPGKDVMQRHESVDVLLSSYGPNASGRLSILRDGLLMDQNRDVLVAAGMNVYGTTPIIAAPSLVKERWLRRFDMTLQLRRQIRREYPILNILSAQGAIQSQGMADTKVIEVPFAVTE